MRRNEIVNNKLPGPVDLVVADHEQQDEATIWIEARFALEYVETEDARRVLHEALARLQQLARGAQDNLDSVNYV
jgi:hypothetical protein